MSNSKISKSIEPRFILLDGLRGLASLGIIALHVGLMPESTILVVDFFFVLSGFVLQPQIANNQFKQFVYKRIKRLMPLSLISLLIALIVKFLEFLKEKLIGEPGVNEVVFGNLWSFICAAFLMQILFTASIYWNGPMWSLSAEMFGNLTSAFTKKFGNYAVYISIATGILSLLYAIKFESNYYLTQGPIFHFFAIGRILLGFNLGLITRQIFSKTTDRVLPKNQATLIFEVILLLLIAFSLNAIYSMIYWYSLIIAPFAFAALILFTAKIDYMFGRIGKLFSALGNYSFGIYVFDTPLVPITLIITSILCQSTENYQYWMILHFLVRVFFAIFVTTFCERIVIPRTRAIFRKFPIFPNHSK